MEALKFLAIPVFAFLNRARGGGFRPLNKATAFIGMGITAGLAAYTAGLSYYLIALAVVAMGGAVAIALSPGWGRYFTAFTGFKAPLHESEVKWIDNICDKIYGTDYDNWTENKIKLYGATAFTFRALYVYPVFILLSFINPWYLLIGLGVFSMGLVYWLTQFTNWQKYGTTFPEMVYGAILGALYVIGL